MTTQKLKPTSIQKQTLIKLNVLKASGCCWNDNGKVMGRKFKVGRRVGCLYDKRTAVRSCSQLICAELLGS